MKQIIYLSGPVTGIENLNEPHFREWAKKLSDMGYFVVVPHDYVKPDTDWNAAMRKCIEIMMHCDMLVTLPDWANSKGACIEVDLARKLGMPVHLCHSVKPAEELT